MPRLVSHPAADLFPPPGLSSTVRGTPVADEIIRRGSRRVRMPADRPTANIREDTFQIERPLVSDGGKLCFGVAAAALTAALLSVVVNFFLAGWMAAGGMAVIGLLYLGMGLAEVRWKEARARRIVRRTLLDVASIKRPMADDLRRDFAWSSHDAEVEKIINSVLAGN